MAMQGLFLHETAHSAQMHGQQPVRGRRHEDTNAAFRSPLLEEFRNSKDRKWTLKVEYFNPCASKACRSLIV